MNSVFVMGLVGALTLTSAFSHAAVPAGVSAPSDAVKNPQGLNDLTAIGDWTQQNRAALDQNLNIFTNGTKLSEVGNFDDCMHYKIELCFLRCKVGPFKVLPVPGIKFEYAEPSAVAEVRELPCKGNLNKSAGLISGVGNKCKDTDSYLEVPKQRKMSEDGKEIRPLSYYDVTVYGVVKPHGPYLMNASAGQATQANTCYIVGKIYQVVNYAKMAASVVSLGGGLASFSFSNLFSNIANIPGQMMTSLQDGLQSMTDWVNGLGDLSISDLAGDIGDSLYDSTIGAAQRFGEQLVNLPSDIANSIETSISSLEEMAQNGYDFFSDTGGSILESFENGTVLTDVGDWIEGGVTSIADAGTDFVGGLESVFEGGGPLGQIAGVAGGMDSEVYGLFESVSQMQELYGVGQKVYGIATSGNPAMAAAQAATQSFWDITRSGGGQGVQGVAAYGSGSMKEVANALETSGDTSLKAAMLVRALKGLQGGYTQFATAGYNFKLPESKLEKYGAEAKAFAKRLRAIVNSKDYIAKYRRTLSRVVRADDSAHEATRAQIWQYPQLALGGNGVVAVGMAYDGVGEIMLRNAQIEIEDITSGIYGSGISAINMLNHSMLYENPVQQCGTLNTLRKTATQLDGMAKTVNNEGYNPGVYSRSSYTGVNNLQHQDDDVPGYGCPLTTAGYLPKPQVRGNGMTFVNCEEVCEEQDQGEGVQRINCEMIPKEGAYMPPGKTCSTNQLSTVVVDPVTGAVSDVYSISRNKLYPACNGRAGGGTETFASEYGYLDPKRPEPEECSNGNGDWRCGLSKQERIEYANNQYYEKSYGYSAGLDHRKRLADARRAEVRKAVRTAQADANRALAGMEALLRATNNSCQVGSYGKENLKNAYQGLKPASVQQQALQSAGYRDIADKQQMKEGIEQLKMQLSRKADLRTGSEIGLGGGSYGSGWVNLATGERKDVFTDVDYEQTMQSIQQDLGVPASELSRITSANGKTVSLFKPTDCATASAMTGTTESQCGVEEGLVEEGWGIFQTAQTILGALDYALLKGGISQMATAYLNQYDITGGLRTVFESTRTNWMENQFQMKNQMQQIMLQATPGMMEQIYAACGVGKTTGAGGKVTGVLEKVSGCMGAWGFKAFRHGWVTNQVAPVRAALVYARAIDIPTEAGLLQVNLKGATEFNYDSVPDTKNGKCAQKGSGDPTWYGGLAALNVPTINGLTGGETKETHIFTEWKNTACCINPCDFKQYY